MAVYSLTALQLYCPMHLSCSTYDYKLAKMHKVIHDKNKHCSDVFLLIHVLYLGHA